ncbi:LacI family DNA-binding transcriptional regulator [Limnochorda pilosa]|uniref:LacI family DNA-binding transcriptional regulator n=1 Tax=Limnochorda pilosa TaxID=1555112 RepID=UPI00082979DE
MPVTLRDVARLAGVSAATASLALNGKGTVSAATRERVVEAARKLDYYPNGLARGLVTRSSHTIGLVVPDITNSYFHDFAKGVEEAAWAAGYTVILGNSDREPATELRYVSVLREKGIDGLILAGAGVAHHPELAARVAALQGDGVPVVVAGRSFLPAPAVVVEDVAGAIEATQHLIRLGHRRVAHITGPRDHLTGQDRLEGFRLAMKAGGLSVREHWVVPGDFSADGGFQAMQSLLDRAPVPTAVFCGNDLTAVGAMRATRLAGLRIPQDISIVGFGDIRLASYLDPPLSTVRVPLHELGRAAGERLLQFMTHARHAAGQEQAGGGAARLAAKQDGQPLTIPVHLVIRESTAPPARSGPSRVPGSPREPVDLATGTPREPVRSTAASPARRYDR